MKVSPRRLVPNPTLLSEAGGMHVEAREGVAAGRRDSPTLAPSAIPTGLTTGLISATGFEKNSTF